jgi:hypothetical protein
MDKTPLDFEPDEIRRRTRRSLLITGAAAAIGRGLWKWLNSWSRIDGLNAPFRRVLDFNAAIARGLFREGAHAPEYKQGPRGKREPCWVFCQQSEAPSDSWFLYHLPKEMYRLALSLRGCIDHAAYEKARLRSLVAPRVIRTADHH